MVQKRLGITDLNEGGRVLVPALKKYGYVIRKRSEPRAYDVEGRVLRRNTSQMG